MQLILAWSAVLLPRPDHNSADAMTKCPGPSCLPSPSTAAVLQLPPAVRRRRVGAASTGAYHMAPASRPTAAATLLLALCLVAGAQGRSAQKNQNYTALRCAGIAVRHPAHIELERERQELQELATHTHTHVRDAVHDAADHAHAERCYARCMCACVRVHMYLFACVRACAWVHACVCVRACVCAIVFVHGACMRVLLCVLVVVGTPHATAPHAPAPTRTAVSMPTGAHDLPAWPGLSAGVTRSSRCTRGSTRTSQYTGSTAVSRWNPSDSRPTGMGVLGCVA